MPSEAEHPESTSNRRRSERPQRPRTGSPAGEMTDKDRAQMSYNPMRNEFEKLDEGIKELEGDDVAARTQPKSSPTSAKHHAVDVKQAKEQAKATLGGPNLQPSVTRPSPATHSVKGEGGDTQKAQMAPAAQGAAQTNPEAGPAGSGMAGLGTMSDQTSKDTPAPTGQALAAAKTAQKPQANPATSTPAAKGATAATPKAQAPVVQAKRPAQEVDETATTSALKAPGQTPIQHENWAPDEFDVTPGTPEKLRVHASSDEDLIEAITAKLAEMLARALKESVAQAVAESRAKK